MGKDFATGVGATLYEGAPPLEELKLIMGIASGNEGKGLHTRLSNAKRAYSHAETLRELYGDIPKEDFEWTPDLVGCLRLALYGTRDAAMLLQECVSKHLLSVGFVRGMSKPCAYHHRARGLRTMAHGDDYA